MSNLVQLDGSEAAKKKSDPPKSLASQTQKQVIVAAGQTATLFSIPGPGRLLALLLAANPYAAYTVADTASLAGPWLPYPFTVPGSAPVPVPPGTIRPALLVELFASAKQQTYGPGLAASTIVSFNTTDWAGSFVTDANGNVILENFYLNPPQGWYFGSYLNVSVTGIFNGNTSVSASILVEVF